MRAFAVVAVAAVIASPAVADELDALAKTVDEHPEDAKAYDAYAVQALRAKRYDDVIKRVKIGTARIPDYTQGYYWLALAYRSKKEWADAADYYRRYIEKNPTKTDPWFGLAASLEGLGDKKGATAAYEKYISLEKSPDKQRFVDLAREELAKLAPPPVPVAAPAKPAPVAAPATPAPPPRADAAQLRQQAEQLRKDGKLDEAAAAYQRAIDADRGNVELYNELGNVWFALKKYDSAADAFRQATARDPNYALGWYNLAHALRKGDKKAEAVQAYRAYMKLKPDDPDPYYGLGQTLKALGDVNGAIDAFRKYVAMEKRPEEQRWVDKARIELESLEAMQKSTAPARGANEKIQEKDVSDGLVRESNQRLERDLGRDADRVFIDPFRRDPDALIDPFGNSNYQRPERDLRDPFREDMRLLPPQSLAPTERLREYSRALESYRRALSHQIDIVSERYERGVAFALDDDRLAATRAWNAVPLTDAQVEAARRSVERLRAKLASR